MDPYDAYRAKPEPKIPSAEGTVGKAFLLALPVVLGMVTLHRADIGLLLQTFWMAWSVFWATLMMRKVWLLLCILVVQGKSDAAEGLRSLIAGAGILMTVVGLWRYIGLCERLGDSWWLAVGVFVIVWGFLWLTTNCCPDDDDARWHLTFCVLPALAASHEVGVAMTVAWPLSICATALIPHGLGIFAGGLAGKMSDKS